MTRTVQLEQPGARVRESETAPAVGGRDPWPVVTNLEMHVVADARGGNLHFSHAAVGDRAVPDRILDQRLEQERRHHGRRCLRIDPEGHPQPVAETRFLNRDVMVEQLELLFECDERSAFAIKRLAQQLREPRDHAIRLLGVLEHESRNRVQRIKEEVRLELADERVESRLDELHLEPLGAPRVIQSRHHRVHEQVERPVHRHRVTHAGEERVRRAIQAECPLRSTL